MKNLTLSLLTLLFSAYPAAAQTPAPSLSFAFPERGSVSATTEGIAGSLGGGYAVISQTGSVPAGFAIFSLRQNDVIVSETTIPAADLVNEGRIHVEIGGGVNTGVAIANPNTQPVDIGFYFTNATGTKFGTNVLTIPANGQVANFLTDQPFNAGSNLQGTFTFFTLRSGPDQGVGAIALRGLVNERGDFLMTTLPVVPIGPRGLFSSDTLPHFAAGSGWATQIVLVNPTDSELVGNINFRNSAGNPVVIATESGPGSQFSYRIGSGGSWTLKSSAAGALATGSVRIANTGIGSDIPIGYLIVELHASGVTVSATGIPPTRTATSARLFVETSGNFAGVEIGSFQTAVALSNASSSQATQVFFDLTTSAGVPTGLTGFLDIPASGQVARFLTEIPGFAGLPSSFQGVLRISSPSSPIIAVGLRARYNERRDFVMTTVPAINEQDPYFNFTLRYSDFVFPHFADGFGYTTQFVLFSGWEAGSTNGTLRFFSRTGAPLPLTLRTQ